MSDISGNVPPSYEELPKTAPHIDLSRANQCEFPCCPLPPNLSNYQVDHQRGFNYFNSNLNFQDTQNPTTNYHRPDQGVFQSHHTAAHPNYHHTYTDSRPYTSQPAYPNYRSISNNQMPYLNHYPSYCYPRHSSVPARPGTDHSNYGPHYYGNRYFWKQPINNIEQPSPSRFNYQSSLGHPREDRLYAQQYSYPSYDYRNPLHGYPRYSLYPHFEGRPGSTFQPSEYYHNFLQNSANYDHAPQNTVPRIMNAQLAVAPRKDRQIKPNDSIPHPPQKLSQIQSSQPIKEPPPVQIPSMEAINDLNFNKNKPINCHENNPVDKKVGDLSNVAPDFSETSEIISETPLKKDVCLDGNRHLMLPVGHIISNNFENIEQPLKVDYTFQSFKMTRFIGHFEIFLNQSKDDYHCYNDVLSKYSKKYFHDPPQQVLHLLEKFSEMTTEAINRLNQTLFILNDLAPLFLSKV